MPSRSPARRWRKRCAGRVGSNLAATYAPRGMTDTPLRIFNSLTRQLESFEPIHDGEARVYSCGPTVYNYPHIGNMRAYVFADVLGRTLSWRGYKLTHVINITDVGHLTDDPLGHVDRLGRRDHQTGRRRQRDPTDVHQHDACSLLPCVVGGEAQRRRLAPAPRDADDDGP